MKKRILALALAGTTAFSVFGAAISANAATSAERYYEVDAYMDYTPVAEKINTTTATSNTDNYAIDLNNPSTPVYFTIVSKASDRNPSENKYLSVEDYIKYNKDVKEEYAAETLYTFSRDAAGTIENDPTPRLICTLALRMMNVKPPLFLRIKMIKIIPTRIWLVPITKRIVSTITLAL